MTPPLSNRPVSQYNADTMSEELAEAVRRVLDEVPGSDRALARAAGISPSTLYRIRSGDRGCSPEIAEKLADTLQAWSENTGQAAAHLRRELDEEDDGE